MQKTSLAFNTHVTCGRVSHTTWFEALNKEPVWKATPTHRYQALCLFADDVRSTLSSLNPCKAAEPDNTLSRVFRECVDQLAGVLTDIFNTSLSHFSVPDGFSHQ